ncbi:hypothetical protein [Paenibacillus sp. P46E]|nr:hypothetical protein [Paenibacillus sp. P46E]
MKLKQEEGQRREHLAWLIDGCKSDPRERTLSLHMRTIMFKKAE